MSIIKVDELHFSYGEKEVLKGIEFTIDKSRFVGIIGANGCGKSTLLKNISGYLAPTSGKIFICGKDINRFNIKEKARYIGYVPQDLNYDFEFSCYDIVMMGRFPYLKRFQSEKKIDRDVVRECMEITNTWQFKDTSIRELSGGERQRVYISRALAQKPQILLMDEPVSHLDIKYQVEILSLLKELSSKGILVIAVLHDINLTSQYCDEIFMMKDGRIMASGSPRNVLTRSNIQIVFSIDVDVLDNPVLNAPYVIPSFKGKGQLKVV